MPWRAGCRSKRLAASCRSWSRRDSSGGILRPMFEIEPLDIPKYVGFQNGGMKIADGVFGAGKNIRAREENHGLILGENFLCAVIEFLPLFERARGHLFLDRAIDFRFPLGRRVRLRRVPQMRSAAR